MSPADIAQAEAVVESVRSVQRLTKHQKTVLIYTCKGLNRVQIAEVMGCQKTSVDDSKTRIRGKLGVSSMIEAAVIAAKAGLV